MVFNMLKVENLNFSYGNFDIKEISLNVEEGEVFNSIGPKW